MKPSNPRSRVHTTLIFLFTAFILTTGETVAQITPAGLVVIQNPTGVYYIFDAEGAYPNGATFFYLNYATQDLDAITPTLSSNGHFSGVSGVSGRSVTGQIQADSITLTYNGVTKSANKESSYGVTRKFAGEWLGFVNDPTGGISFAELLISSRGECMVFSYQGFFSEAGIGSISSSGNAVVPLLSGRTASGLFAPVKGIAQGTLNLSTGEHQTYALIRAIPARLANISTRGLVGTGQQVLIAGFIVTDGGKTVVIDAKGPSLSTQGIQNPVRNPRLALYRGSQLIASNNDWRQGTKVSEIAASGLAPTNDREPALQVDLQPGAYTAIVSSEDATTGVGLVEVFGVGGPFGP